NEVAKSDEIAAHLSFYPMLMMYETRPLMADLLSPGVADLNGALNGKMDMLLYAWLDNDTGKVREWITGFESESNPSYDNLAFAWKNPKKKNTENINKEPTKNPVHHRLDYLLLKELDRHGVPPGASDQTGDWLEHWREGLQALGGRLKQAWD